MDRTRATAGHQAVVLAARVGGRAVPPARRVRATSGAIGSAERRRVLETVAGLPPADAEPPVLMGDRFHGTPDPIEWCRARGRDRRLRLKRELPAFGAEGGETTLGECFARGERMLSSALAI